MGLEEAGEEGGRLSYSGQEVRDSHGSGCPVAPLDAAVLAERDVGAPVR